MSVLEIKNDLLRLLVETDDEKLLDKVLQYFRNLKKDQTDQKSLEAQEAAMVDAGLQQVDSEQVMTHEEARKKIKERLSQYKK